MNRVIASLLFCSASALALLSCSSPKPVSIIWTQGPTDSLGYAIHDIAICNAPKTTDMELVFNSFSCSPDNTFSVKDSDGEISHINGTFFRFVPRRIADTLHFRYRNQMHRTWKRSWVPTDLHLRTGGKWSDEIIARYEFLGPREPFKERAPDLSGAGDLNVADMVPSVKKFSFTEGKTPFVRPQKAIVGGLRPEGYRIVIDGSVRLEAADSAGLFYARQTLARIVENCGGTTEIPNLVIEDWPDYPFRGFMLDASRCFYTKDEVLRFIDMMARYRLNKFHFHMTDDDAWRLEMPQYPGLAEKGSFRSFPHRGQGRYYSCEDYVEIVKYARERHIEVIPEVDIPAHSLAVVESVPGLVDPNDTSSYLSAQGYHHNVLDVSLPAVYDFIGQVFDHLAALHQKAGVKLTTIHIGGDEVARGAWMGSPSCIALMKEKGWEREEQLQGYFTARVKQLAADRGMKIAGWQEMAVEDADYAHVNAWTPSTRGDVTTPLVKRGFKVIVSDASRLYMDNAYGPDVRQRGLGWAGYTDMETAWSLPNHEGIYGVEVHIWGENLAGFTDAWYMLFPKALGAFERTWNRLPEKPDFGCFQKIVYSREMPAVAAMGR